MKRHVASCLIAGLMAVNGATQADDPKRIGSVDTTFKLLGRNDRIVVERYDDPRVDGVIPAVPASDSWGASQSMRITIL